MPITTINMASQRFFVPDSSPPSSPAPSTPDKKPYGGGFSFLGENPSTTPAGPPPSSAASFTPAGAPSDSYLGSSIMRGVTGSKPLNFGLQSQGSSTGRNLFGPSDRSNAPLGRSIRGRGRQPSGLSRQFSANDDDEDDDDDDDASGEDAEGEDELPPHRGSLFRSSLAPRNSGVVDESEDDMETQMERYIDEEMAAEEDEEEEGEEEEEEEEEEEDASADEVSEDAESASVQGSEEGDMFLNMRHDDRLYGQPVIGDETDLMVLSVAGATDRIRQEAESLYRRSTRPGSIRGGRGFQFATIAKDTYTRQDVARLTEPNRLILRTEYLVSRLYDEGVGTEDDAEKLDNSLANVTHQLVRLWNDHVEDLPTPEGEDFATIGPGANTEPFEKATFIAHLILRMHHTRFDNETGDEKTPPLPDILFDWLQVSHNLYPDQLREIRRYKPSPACHGLYWQTLRCALLRGDVTGASELLKNAGWENIRRGPRGDKSYTGKALENVRRFAAATAEMLDSCPGARSEWDVWNSDWTLFRVQARGSLDRMTLFAEGKDTQFQDSMQEDFSAEGESLSTMAKKASSQIPWEIYENLQTVYGIVLGDTEAIMETAQDWCEATVGLFGWWDDGMQHQKGFYPSQSRNLLASTGPSLSSHDYFDRLASAFHLVLGSDMNPNTLNPVEIAIASAFEGDINAVIGLLRMWSLPIACSVAEIASLGQWLPLPESMPPLPTGDLDMDDLALLGVAPPSSDDTEGIKDTTIVIYARELAGIEQLSEERAGWEMAIQVLGRMDLPEKSEETVSELLRDLLATLDEHSGKTVDKMWRILNDLGMINFAEETAEVSSAQCLDVESEINNTNKDADFCRNSVQRVPSIRRSPLVLCTFSPA